MHMAYAYIRKLNAKLEICTQIREDVYRNTGAEIDLLVWDSLRLAPIICN